MCCNCCKSSCDLCVVVQFSNVPCKKLPVVIPYIEDTSWITRINHRTIIFDNTYVTLCACLSKTGFSGALWIIYDTVCNIVEQFWTNNNFWRTTNSINKCLIDRFFQITERFALLHAREKLNNRRIRICEKILVYWYRANKDRRQIYRMNFPHISKEDSRVLIYSSSRSWKRSNFSNVARIVPRNQV